MARTMGVAEKRSAVSQASRRSQEASTLLDHAEVAKVAYELFERRGGTHGHDVQDWIEAEQIVQRRRNSGNGR